MSRGAGGREKSGSGSRSGARRRGRSRHGIRVHLYLQVRYTSARPRRRRPTALVGRQLESATQHTCAPPPPPSPPPRPPLTHRPTYPPAPFTFASAKQQERQQERDVSPHDTRPQSSKDCGRRTPRSRLPIHVQTCAPLLYILSKGCPPPPPRSPPTPPPPPRSPRSPRSPPPPPPRPPLRHEKEAQRPGEHARWVSRRSARFLQITTPRQGISYARTLCDTLHTRTLRCWWPLYTTEARTCRHGRPRRPVRPRRPGLHLGRLRRPVQRAASRRS